MPDSSPNQNIMPQQGAFMVVNITQTMVKQVRDITLRAGRVIMEVYGTDFSVDTKEDRSPVTEADLRADALIVKAIKEEIADTFPIISEETFEDQLTIEVANGPFWLVDPLDGTKQFVQRNGEFTVNIALIDAGLPVLGVVHSPATSSTYWASRYGAFAMEHEESPRQINTRKMPTDGLSVCVSRSHRTSEVDAYLKAFSIKEEITSGSSIKFCMVASGRCDLYPRMGRTMEWDTAAGHAIIRFAGGTVNKLDGLPLTYGKVGFENPNFIVKGDPSIPTIP
jgi:3'(2'), 5'-bisphosphate nucleotidase